MAEEESVRIQQAEAGVTALDYILDGLEAELALERELSVRSVECARDVLAPLEKKSPVGSGRPVAPEPAPVQQPIFAPLRPTAPRPTSAVYDFAFLHDRPLSADGAEMMAKIVAALGKTAATAPIVWEGTLPKAKVIVVLGGNALKKWFPGATGAPGQWIVTPSVKNVLVTYSPVFILRFKVVTPEVKKIKRAMWDSLKSIEARLKNVE